MARSIIFAGCVRDCAPYLPQVLANCARFAAMAGEAAFVFAENDSQDGSKAILADWCRGRDNAHILCFDGLDASLRLRTERIAFLRNRIMAFVKERGLADYDALCMLDFDEVNASEIAPDGFAAALEFLFAAPDHAGIFAVSDPVYYDIYALRHEHWSPAIAGRLSAVRRWRICRICFSPSSVIGRFRSKRLTRRSPSSRPSEVWGFIV